MFHALQCVVKYLLTSEETGSKFSQNCITKLQKMKTLTLFFYKDLMLSKLQPAGSILSAP